jgi:hypothetical protein
MAGCGAERTIKDPAKDDGLEKEGVSGPERSFCRPGLRQVTELDMDELRAERAEQEASAEARGAQPRFAFALRWE